MANITLIVCCVKLTIRTCSGRHGRLATGLFYGCAITQDNVYILNDLPGLFSVPGVLQSK